MKNKITEGLASKIAGFVFKRRAKDVIKKLGKDPRYKSIGREVQKFDKAWNDLQKAIEKSRKTGKPIPRNMKFDL